MIIIYMKRMISDVGNYKIFLHEEFSGRIPYCAILIINILISKITKHPTTTVNLASLRRTGSA